MKSNERILVTLSLTLLAILTGLGILVISISYLTTSTPNQVGLLQATQSEKRAVSYFTSVELYGNLSLEINKGSEHTIAISERALNNYNITYTIQDQRLIITQDTNIIDRLRGNFGVYDGVIKITTPSIRRAVVYSSGNITTNNLTGQELDLEVSGSGTINSKNTEVDTVYAFVIGSGTIDLSGNAQNTFNEVVGSGSIQADKMQSQTVSSNITGSGLIRCNAKESLIVTIDGSGAVEYSGSPDIVQNITGSGRVNEQ